jgi:hypothetical protein
MWLMLVLESSLDWSQFPPQVLQMMESLNLSKDDRKVDVDLRCLKDSEGRAAAALVQEVDGV